MRERFKRMELPGQRMHPGLMMVIIAISVVTITELFNASSDVLFALTVVLGFFGFVWIIDHWESQFRRH